MDWDHIHIMINHFPVILAVMGAVVALLGVLRGRRGVWMYATASLTLAGLTAVATYFSGRAAEDVVRHAWYIGRGSIHTHEDAALVATIATAVAALVAAVAWRRLVRYPREITLPGGLRTAVVLTALASAGSIGYASWLGGQITHDAPGLKAARPATAAPGVATPAAVTPTVTAPVRSDSTAPTNAPAATPPGSGGRP
jgi:uncharacterized membrane protein